MCRASSGARCCRASLPTKSGAAPTVPSGCPHPLCPAVPVTRACAASRPTVVSGVVRSASPQPCPPRSPNACCGALTHWRLAHRHAVSARQSGGVLVQQRQAVAACDDRAHRQERRHDGRIREWRERSAVARLACMHAGRARWAGLFSCFRHHADWAVLLGRRA
jgi:hypothetical protein